MEFIRRSVQYLCSGDNYHFFTFSGNTTSSPTNDNAEENTVPSLKSLCSNYVLENVDNFSSKDIEKIPLEIVQDVFHRLEKRNDSSHFYLFRNSGIESGNTCTVIDFNLVSITLEDNESLVSIAENFCDTLTTLSLLNSVHPSSVTEESFSVIANFNKLISFSCFVPIFQVFL